MLRLFKNPLNHFTIISILLFSASGFAQDISFGAKAGMNLSSLRGDYPGEIDKKKPVIGFHFGGFALYDVDDRIAIQPELLFSKQGVTTEVEQGSSSLTQSYKLNYLNFALMGKYLFFEHLSLEFGPQIGYMLSAKSKWEYEDATDPSNNESVTLDLLNGGFVDFQGETLEGEGRINRFDIGLNLGASYQVDENIFVQARYNLGLLVVDKNSTAVASFDSWNLKNSVFQLSFGYTF